MDEDPSAGGIIDVLPGTISLSAATRIDLEDSGIIHEKLVTYLLGHTIPREKNKVSDVLQSIGKTLDDILSSGSSIRMSVA